MAAECKSIVAFAEPRIEGELVKIASGHATDFKKVSQSTKGFLALSELGRFDDISNIFGSRKKIPAALSNVVINIIDEGTEAQISNLLEIIAENDQNLLIRGLDKAADKSIYFSSSSLKIFKRLCSQFEVNNDILVVGKLVAATRTKLTSIKPEDICIALLNKKQVKSCQSVSTIYAYIPGDVEKYRYYLEKFSDTKTNEGTILELVELLRAWKLSISDQQIASLFSKHLNPKVRDKYFDNLGEVDLQIIRDVIRYHLESGGISSLEFVLQLVKKYNLSQDFPISGIIKLLLGRVSIPRVKLVVKLLNDLDIDDAQNKRAIFYTLLNTNLSQGLDYICDYIDNNFRGEDRTRCYYRLIVALSLKKKLWRQIRKVVYNRINRVFEVIDLKPNNIYLGFVQMFNEYNYTVEVGKGHYLKINRKKGDGHLFIKINHLVSMKATSFVIGNMLEAELINHDFMKFIEKGNTYYDMFFGQVFPCRIVKIFDKELWVTAEGIPNRFRSYRGKIRIEEIGHKFYQDLNSEFQVGDVLSASFWGFDHKYRLLYFSSRIITIRYDDTRSPKRFLSNDELAEKILKLQKLLRE